MTIYSSFNDFKEYPIVTKNNNNSKIKLYSSYLILNGKKNLYKNLKKWFFTSEDLFFLIFHYNKVKYFTSKNKKQISDDLYSKCKDMDKDDILNR